jgi:uncharacterized protein YukE
MSTIRMETEGVRDAARQIDYAVQELSMKPRRLKSAANSLKSAWTSRQATRFANELKKKASILDNEVANLQQLAQRMRNEVNEWETNASALIAGKTIEDGKAIRKIKRIIDIRRNWEKKDLDERKKWLEDWYNELCEKLGIPPTKFKVEDLEDPKGKDAKGVFRAGIIFGLFQSMTIDVDNVEGNDPIDVLDTIAHETRHQYQHYLVDHPDKRSDNISLEQIESWKENFDNYKKADDDFQAYRNQPVEADAREAAESMRNDYLAGETEVI